MKSSVSLTWLTGLVLGFILLFAAFLILTIQYSAVFRQKNGVISILEKYNGYSENSKKLIANYLSSSGYKGYGKCPTNDTYTYYGVTSDGDVVSMEEADADTNFSYCISANKAKYENAVYYRIILFFRFDLAGNESLGNILTFKINGLTTNIYGYSNKYAKDSELKVYS